MRKPVLLACLLSLAVLWGGEFCLAVNGEVEPGAGSSGASASLASVEGSPPVASVRIGLVSTVSDAEATVTAVRTSSDGETLRTLGSWIALVSRSVPATLLVKVGVEPGQENHIIFRADMKMADGSSSQAEAYLRVNLDPALEPELAGDYIQFRGVSGREVKP